MSAPDFESLEFADHEKDELSKTQLILAPLFISPEFTLHLDSGGKSKICTSESRELGQALLRHVEREVFRASSPYLITYDFGISRPEEPVFEATEKVRVLCTAIRITTGMRCSIKASFDYNDTKTPVKYFRPYVLAKQEDDYSDFREVARIEDKESFEKLISIYENLRKLGFSSHYTESNKTCRLVNALITYDSAYDVHWYKLRVTILLIALESLFTDSSKNEISYKIALRTAFFLRPSDAIDRRRIFNLVKIAYDLRSQFVHGNSINSASLDKRFKTASGTELSVWYHLPDLVHKIVSEVLAKASHDEGSFKFFSKRQSELAENQFFDDLILQ